MDTLLPSAHLRKINFDCAFSHNLPKYGCKYAWPDHWQNKRPISLDSSAVLESISWPLWPWKLGQIWKLYNMRWSLTRSTYTPKLVNILQKISEKMHFFCIWLWCHRWPVEKQIWKKSLHLFEGTVPRNNCTKFQKNPFVIVRGDAILTLSAAFSKLTSMTLKSGSNLKSVQ